MKRTEAGDANQFMDSTVAAEIWSRLREDRRGVRLKEAAP
jgi:hypothetical protein